MVLTACSGAHRTPVIGADDGQVKATKPVEEESNKIQAEEVRDTMAGRWCFKEEAEGVYEAGVLPPPLPDSFTIEFSDQALPVRLRAIRGGRLTEFEFDEVKTDLRAFSAEAWSSIKFYFVYDEIRPGFIGLTLLESRKGGGGLGGVYQPCL